MAEKKKPAEAAVALMDKSMPWEHRKRLIVHLAMGAGEEGDHALQSLCDAAANSNGDAVYAQKLKEVNELIQEMTNGPLRTGVFVRMLNGSLLAVPRAHVVLQDGESAYTVVPDAGVAQSLRCGDMVLLEAQGRVLVARDPSVWTVGEEGRFERRIGDDRVEVTVRDHETLVFRVSAKLLDKLNAGSIKPGAKLLVCARRYMAFDDVPAPDGLQNYWYVQRDPVPDVIVERDIGSPPGYIDELVEHLRGEMLTPDLHRRYRMRPAQTKLLTGVSGSGKTLSIMGVWRRMYDLMSEVTGVPIEELPPRVLRLRMPQVLNKWLGESDKRLNRFFEEIEQLAAEPFVAPDGKKWYLPVLAIAEEIDALARARGEGDPIYDRIMTTGLERLDATCQKFKDQLVVFLFTSNVPHLVDPAFLRRAGGTIERFGRLDKRGFQAVLAKHIRELPFQEQYGAQDHAEQRAVRSVTDWLFSRNGHDPGQVTVTFVGSATPVLKFRRDFLTGALVDRAVQQAAAEACRAERSGGDEPGVTSELLIGCIDAQIRGIVEQLTPANVHNYLTLPDGMRVGDLRRLRPPAVSAYELEHSA